MVAGMVGGTRFGYAFQGFDPSVHVRASAREVKISHKHAREIARSLRGMKIDEARGFLGAVVRRERAVPFRRFKTQVGHRSDSGVMAGRYPAKAATEIARLLENLESNAEVKGLDGGRLRIVGAAAHKGVSVKRFIPRARGQATPRNDVMTHVEIVAREV